MIGGYVKSLFRRGLFWAGLDVTRNMKYDRLTMKIMQKVLRPGSNCLDVGSHEGEVLQKCMELAPRGRHYAFEPIPEYFEQLIHLYGRRATVLPYALADESGRTLFHFVRNAPAYSGLKRRQYKVHSPAVSQIDVDVRRLDDVIPQELHTDFIKIDVEGAEFQVLKGGKNLIKRCSPVIVFEFGLGASDYYGSGPDDLYHLLVEDCCLKISLLKSFLDDDLPLSQEQFRHHYHQKDEFYFVAHP